ncbi:MAG: hypothetical protein ACK4ON_14105, partial [Bacteroidia bacterium]
GPNGFSSGQSTAVINSTDVASSGTYTYTAINPGNCTDTAIVTLTVIETPANPSVTNASTCVGDTLMITASGTGVINWYSDAALNNLISNSDTLYPNINDNTSTIYYVTISNNGCTSDSVPVTVSNYNINASFTPAQLSGYVPLNVNFVNTSTGIDQNDNFNWTLNGSTFSTLMNSSYNFEQGGTFNVALVVTDSPSGCVDTAYATIVVDDEIRVVIPNIFTPNNDGINDTGAPRVEGYQDYEVLIHD